MTSVSDMTTRLRFVCRPRFCHLGDWILMYVLVGHKGNKKNHMYCLKIEDSVKIKVLFNKRY